MRKVQLLVLMVIVAQFSFGQKADLVTDRPDQTESAVTVPLGSIQIETGFLQKSMNSFTDTYYNSSLIRVGLFEKAELRIGSGILNSGSLSQSEVGMTALMLGTKVKFSDENGFLPQMAVLAELTLPYFGTEVYRPDHTEMKFLLSFSHTLSDQLSIGYNMGSSWANDTNGNDWLYSVSMGYAPFEKLGFFAEIYGGTKDHFYPDNAIDFGVMYLLKDLIQFDASYGFGLSEGSYDNFINAGLSFRLFK